VPHSWRVDFCLWRHSYDQDCTHRGGWPVGLTAATELARYGIAVRIVDKAPQRTDKSKAVVLWSRTLELLDRGGGSAPFREAGFNIHAVNVVADDGATVGRVTMDTVDSPYPYALMLPQSDTERLLEDRLRSLGVEVERASKFCGYPDSPLNGPARGMTSGFAALNDARATPIAAGSERRTQVD
jgi:hypothetical protein